MYSIKKAIAVLLTLALCVSMSLTVSAANISTDQRAKTLNRLNILLGDGTNFFLGDSIKRSEAAAFIIRILGKEEYVKQNSDTYKNTKYPDVGSKEWYASYIGYCSSEGIISGFPDGQYKPNEKISEKAFVKLVLTALGYEYNKDFTWNTVYKKALDIGLLTDTTKYAANPADNLNYKRADAIEVLHNALTKKIKDKEKTLVQNLVNSGAVSKETALDLELIEDTVLLEIKQANAVDSTQVNIILSEEIIDQSDLSISIYETTINTNKLTANIVTIDGKTISVGTSAQTTGVSYTVEIKNAEDTQGNLTRSIKSTFIGYKNPEIVSDFFRISKIDGIDKNTINIYFTQPININAEVANHYSIKRSGNSFVTGSSSSIKLGVIPGVDNGISLRLLNDTFYTGESYTLSISNTLQSIYGLRLMDGLGESMDFMGNGQDVTAMSVVSVLPEDSSTIIVEFSKAVDSSTAISNSNYTITKSGGGQITVQRAAVLTDADSAGRIVKLGLLQPLVEGATYDITIRNVYDRFRINKAPENTFSIAGTSNSKDMNTFMYAEALDNGTISLYTDRPLNNAFASNIAMYTVLSTSDGSYSAVPVKAYYDPRQNPYQVKLYLPISKPLDSNKQYKVRVSNLLKDYLGHSNSSGTDLPFSGNSSNPIKPAMIDAKMIGSKTVKVTMSQEISNIAPNTLGGNYYLEYTSGDTTKKLIPSSVGYINAITLVLRVDSLDFATYYTLKAITIKDYSEQYSATSSDGGNSTGVYMGTQ